MNPPEVLSPKELLKLCDSWFVFAKQGTEQEDVLQKVQTPVTDSFWWAQYRHRVTICMAAVYSAKTIGKGDFGFHATISGFVERFGRLPDDTDQIRLRYTEGWFFRFTPAVYHKRDPGYTPGVIETIFTIEPFAFPWEPKKAEPETEEQ